MKQNLIIAVLIVGAWMTGCNSQSVGPAPAGAFEYRSYDSLGTLIAEGWMMFVADTSRATGEWHFRKVGDPRNIGPQTGDGTLLGQLLQGQLFLDLNPHYRDNNVLLTGAYDGESYTGTWTYVGFPGELNRGTFSAFRRRR